MDKLKKRINNLERKLDADKSIITQQKNLLSENLHSAKVVFPAVIGGFALGYFLGHKPNVSVKGVSSKLRKISSGTGKILKFAQFLLPLL